MSCKSPKFLRFRVFAYDLPKEGLMRGDKANNLDATYGDTGQEFSVTFDEANDVYKKMVDSYRSLTSFEGESASYCITYLMIQKLYGFFRYSWGYPIQWMKDNFMEGEIRVGTLKHWYIKRIV